MNRTLLTATLIAVAGIALANETMSQARTAEPTTEAAVGLWAVPAFSVQFQTAKIHGLASTGVPSDAGVAQPE